MLLAVRCALANPRPGPGTTLYRRTDGPPSHSLRVAGSPRHHGRSRWVPDRRPSRPSTLVSAWPFSRCSSCSSRVVLLLISVSTFMPQPPRRHHVLSRLLQSFRCTPAPPSLSSSTVSWFLFLSLPFPERLRLVLFSLWPSRTASSPSFGILLSSYLSVLLVDNIISLDARLDQHMYYHPPQTYN